MTNDDADRLRDAANGLAINPRVDRWTHLPLCVLNAVFSIGVKYGGVREVCKRYATFAGLPDPLLPTADVHQVIGTDREQPVDILVEHGRTLGATGLAAEGVLDSKWRTSSRNGILKAEAAVDHAKILASEGVHRLADVAALLADPDRLSTVESRLSTVRGHGSGARLSYLWMVAGDDQRVKPDRMILGWLSDQLDRPVTVPEARHLLADTAAALGCTPWELDHAIWRKQSGRS